MNASASVSRLDNRQIVIMRSLMMRGGGVRPISLDRWQRKSTLPLWRRGLVEIWFRQSPHDRPALPGPFFSLSIVGAQIASTFLPAPRGISGAEHEP